MEEAGHLHVFLSYARADGSTLAEELAGGLELLGFVPVMDRHDIAAAEDWEKRLESLIRQADTIVFLLSPKSVQSPRCAWEVERALSLSKRIVPVLIFPLADEDVPEALRRLNYISFAPGQLFTRALGHLAGALKNDLAWIREHTRLAEMAARWIERDKDEALLLRGAELVAAQEWMAKWHSDAPALTDLQRALIAASGEAAAIRESTERKRLQEIAEANVSRADALKSREEAFAKLRRRTFLASLATGALGLTTGMASFIAWRKELDRRKMELRTVEKEAHTQAQRRDIEGQTVVYSTSPGQAALDDSGFTPALLRHLASGDIPLSLALNRTVQEVLAKTHGKQRPYISTDMNGDIYFHTGPSDRTSHAVVVAIDQMGAFHMPGARPDGEAMATFLRQAKYEVQYLRNARRDEVLGALEKVRLAARTARATMPAATSPSSSAALPATVASLDQPSAHPDSTPHSSPQPGSTLTVTPNTVCVFYFTGGGVRDRSANQLLMTNYPPDGRSFASTDDFLRTTCNVAEIAALLRDTFAASALILDTQFK